MIKIIRSFRTVIILHFWTPSYLAQLIWGKAYKSVKLMGSYWRVFFTFTLNWERKYFLEVGKKQKKRSRKKEREILSYKYSFYHIQWLWEKVSLVLPLELYMHPTEYVSLWWAFCWSYHARKALVILHWRGHGQNKKYGKEMSSDFSKFL